MNACLLFPLGRRENEIEYGKQYLLDILYLSCPLIKLFVIGHSMKLSMSSCSG